ncbi:bifunctional pyr operon transcriptional regulator/uracil phosphoribosyltransferase PyrR [Desulforhabdus amnigena]|uniref:Bifunctional protein PyrR n=1 Tax=Desulforhabdus amnigena TaxID=40218 RepID=A0A9W6FWE1_9BACT|nr:bifunctional pyr operon transcriptional regulator/uracil phosphoribosyltransferase PyrR [Desulforhabdus amnigena]NLJ28298.1 bifunctional pyr operon transcriptional regulator/uracil phosphoribosyltransferase PyrR [Deltaproteobacteria bacterium]GLI36116.1 bifunctional protein PyrR [Desulforhabdus amnigena]
MKELGGRCVMEAVEIEKALERLASEIVQQPVDPHLLALVGIHTGGVYLAKRLERIISDKFHLSIPVGTLDINLYRDDWTRLHTQPIVRATEFPFPIDDREVVLVDDVLFTGRTIRAALNAIMDYGRPKHIQVAVLVDRGHRELPICGQFIGLEIKTGPEEQVNVLLKEKDGVDRVIIESPLSAP